MENKIFYKGLNQKMSKKNPRDTPLQLEPYPTYFYFAEKTKMADYEVQQLVDQVNFFNLIIISFL